MDRDDLEKRLGMSLETWMTQNYQRHLRTARVLLFAQGCKTAQCAEDAVQETYFDLFRRGLSSFKGTNKDNKPCSFDTYFYWLLRGGVTKILRQCPQCRHKVDLREDPGDEAENQDSSHSGQGKNAPLDSAQHNTGAEEKDSENTKEEEIRPDPFADPRIICVRESVCCALDREKRDRSTKTKRGTVPKGWCFLQIRLHELTGPEVVEWLLSPNGFCQSRKDDVIRIKDVCNPALFESASSARQALEKTTAWMIEHQNVTAKNQHIRYLNMAGSLAGIHGNATAGEKSLDEKKTTPKPFGFVIRYLRPCLLESSFHSLIGGKSGCDEEEIHASN